MILSFVAAVVFAVVALKMAMKEPKRFISLRAEQIILYMHAGYI